MVQSIIQYKLNELKCGQKEFKDRHFWTLCGQWPQLEVESHRKASSPACRLFPAVWATSAGGKVNRNHRLITFDCCQWFLDPIGCQKCNPQLISHSSIQLSCIIYIFCTSVKPPFPPTHLHDLHPVAHYQLVKWHQLSIHASEVDTGPNVMTRGEPNYPNRPNHPPRSPPAG